MAPIAIGASIACSGCCLTVVEKGAGLVRGRGLGRDAGQDPARRLEAGQPDQPRTLAASSATSWAAISSPAMSTASAKIVSMTPEGGSVRFVLRGAAPTWRASSRSKGSVAIDGMSLTVNEVDGRPLRREHHSAYPGGHHPGTGSSRASGSTSRSTCWRATLRGCWSTEDHERARKGRLADHLLRSEGRGRGDHRGRPQRPHVHPGRRRGPRERGRPRHPGPDARRPTRSTSWPRTARPDLPGADPRARSSSSACR